jgi:Family of unknown function (DUF6174)
MNPVAGSVTASGLVLLVAASCAQAGHTGDIAGDGSSPAEVAREHREQWEAARVSNYTWHIFVGCFCPVSTSTVKVVDGEPVDLRVDGEPASIKLDQENGFIPLTMEDLFDVLDGAYAKHAHVVQGHLRPGSRPPGGDLPRPELRMPEPGGQLRRLR